MIQINQNKENILKIDEREIEREIEKRVREIIKLPIMNCRKLLVEHEYDIFKTLIYIGSTTNSLAPFCLDYRDSEEVEKLREHYKNGNIKKYIKGLLR